MEAFDGRLQGDERLIGCGRTGNGQEAFHKQQGAPFILIQPGETPNPAIDLFLQEVCCSLAPREVPQRLLPQRPFQSAVGRYSSIP